MKRPSSGKSGGKKQVRRWRGSSPGGDRPPVGDRVGTGGVAGREQDQELVSGQLLGAARRGGRPPGKAPLGEPLVAHPESLAIVHEPLQRRLFAIAKDEDGAGERIVVKDLLAESRQAVDAATEVGGLDSHEDLHLRRDL